MRKPRLSRSFGVEEEYLLLDMLHGTPVNCAEQLIDSVPESWGHVEREFFSCQLETATPVCQESAEAEQALSDFRSTMSLAARQYGVVIAGTGLPPVGGDTPGKVTPDDRYQAIQSQVRAVGAHQYSTGTHVHVEVPSHDAGVEVLARLARWAPVLLALSANSPFWCGEPTGFASWRHVMGLAWPVSGYPPAFADGSDYARVLERLVASGVTLDTGMVTWVARLSERYPTIELRIADAQLEAGDAVSFAVLVRALVERCLSDTKAGDARPGISPSLMHGAIWMAARNGLDSELIDPLTGIAHPAWELIDEMMLVVEPELTQFGDLERVEGYFDRLLRFGNPAARQTQRFAAAGVPGLLSLYGAGATAELDVPARDPVSFGL